MMIRAVSALLLTTMLLSRQCLAFGPEGHQLVGEIADKVLAKKNPAAAAKIKTLLNSHTLKEAATIPDEIKSWDGNPNPRLRWTMDPVLRHQMFDFMNINSNPPGGHGHVIDDHRTFHYTDLSVDAPGGYAKSKTGARPTDVVGMITYCCDIVTKKNPQPDPHDITPEVAVILLAHYVGDIHQPLHVGAVYFDGAGKRVDPDKVSGAKMTHGGNDIQVFAAGSGNFALHSFWDSQAVTAAVHKILGQSGTLSPADIDAKFVSVAPKKPDGSPLDDNMFAVNTLSVRWADEILPIAKEAHDKLDFVILNPPHHLGRYKFFWMGTEKMSGTYLDYSADVVTHSIHRAGWRLAELLERLSASLP